LEEILSLYTDLLNQRENLDPRIIDGVLFGLGMLNIEQPDMGIDIELFKKLSPKDSLEWENKKALAFALSFVSNKKLRKQVIGIAKDFSVDSLANVRKIGGLIISFHENEKDLSKKYFSKPEKLHKEVLQGLFLGSALQGYTQFISTLNNVISNEKDEFQRLDFVFSYILMGLYENPPDLSMKLMKLYEIESKIIRRIILESLGLIVAFNKNFSLNLKILNFLCNRTRVLDQYSSEIALILMLVIHSKSEISELWKTIEDKTITNNEFKNIKEQWDSLSETDKYKHPMKFLEKLSKTDYHDIKLATIYASFFADKDISKEDAVLLGAVITDLVNYRVAYVRDIAISRLLSFSLKHRTMDYLKYFTDNLNLSTNLNEQLYNSIAWGVLSEFGGSSLKRIYDESKAYQNPNIEKGVLIGLGIASNPQIDIDWIDEKILGYFEVFKGNFDHALIFLFLSHFIKENQEENSNVNN
jgi:hypothetical protein